MHDKGCVKTKKFCVMSKKESGGKMQLNKDKMKSKISNITITAAKVFLAVYIVLLLLVGAVDYFIPDNITMFESETSSVVANASVTDEPYTANVSLFGIIPVKTVQVNVLPDTKVIPGGNCFGVKFFTKGVIIINLADIETQDGIFSPAKRAGLKVKDIILSVDGKEINTVEEMATAVEESKGKQMSILYEREGKTYECKMNASLSLSDKKYKTGIWVRDSTAGIGTVTYYNPKNKTFAGLGHGICDIDTGTLMPLLRGSVVDVEVTDIVKGRKGSPGEIKGNFGTQKKGVLTKNTQSGVYGIIDRNFEPDEIMSKAVDIGKSSEVVTGKATIYSEVDSQGVAEYEVMISDIDKTDKGVKNFVVEITDDRLLEKTGGIVQGMSGSPILQNGKLIGAVTHVFVNDPSKGYGIFIENMLKNSPELLQ